MNFPQVEGVRFRRVVEFPDKENYCVGDDGSIWSKRFGTWRRRRPSPDRFGYLWVTFRVGGQMLMRMVHRLILETFTGPCPEGMIACHNNGNPSDNRLGNLRWDTHRSNQADMVRHGTARRGQGHPNAKLTESQVKAQGWNGVRPGQSHIGFGIEKGT